MSRMFNRMVRFGTICSCIILMGCSPPDNRIIAVCKETAATQARGHGLISSDIAELIEACMMSKGYALEEKSARCSDGRATAIKPQCYRPNTVVGRVSSIFK
jgi:hypothetical protein